MAAVLCQSLANICQTLVYVVTCPCRVCGGDSCQWLGRALASPFTPYLLTTVCLHLPPSFWGLRAAFGVFYQSMRCKPGDRWLWINAALSLVHIWGAFYIVRRIQDERRSASSSIIEPTTTTNTEILECSSNEEESAAVWKTGGDIVDGTITSPKTNFFSIRDGPLKKPIKRPTLGDKILYTIEKSTKFPATIPVSKSWRERASRDVVLGVTESDDDGEANSLQRLKQVFCYDTIVAIYMTTTVFWCIWQSIGISHVLFRKRPSHFHNNYAGNHNYNVNNNYNNANNNYDNANYNNANDGGAIYYSYFNAYDSYDEDELCDNIEYWIILSILCSFLYIMLVCVAFSCSLLCMRY
ncbi:hypothetical protein ACA910_008327 [Epithemia clementina (nom. ined.)]